VIHNEKENLPLEDDYISTADKCKYLGVLFTKNGNSKKEINNTVNKDRNIIRALNSILCDKSLRKITKKKYTKLWYRVL
jgi:hypothetical protein